MGVRMTVFGEKPVVAPQLPVPRGVPVAGIRVAKAGTRALISAGVNV